MSEPVACLDREREFIRVLENGEKSEVAERSANAAHLQTRSLAKDQVISRMDEAFRGLPRKEDVALSLYVSGDPFIPRFLRSVYAPGTRFPAAASHFLRDIKDELDVCQKSSQFYPDANEDPLREPTGVLAEKLIASDPSRYHIFGDFIVRESIVSRARYTHCNENGIQLCLTVNFRYGMTREEWDKQSPPFTKLFDDIKNAYPYLPETYKLKAHDLFTQLFKIRQLIHEKRIREWQRCDNQEELFSPNAYLTLILDQLVKAFAQGEDLAGLYGTMHVFCKEQQKLLLAALPSWFGRPKTRDFDVAAGKGVVSWVAMREKAIRICDFLHPQNRPFKKIHVPYIKGIRSQLAVPVIAGKELMGVLNVESAQPNAFGPDCIGFMYAVGREIADLEISGMLHDSQLENGLAGGGDCSLRLKALDNREDLPSTVEPRSDKEESMRQKDSNAIAARLAALFRVSGNGSVYVAGPRFWEHPEITNLPTTMVKSYQAAALQVYCKFGLHNKLDDIMSEWVANGDGSRTHRRLDTEVRHVLWQRMRDANASPEEKDALPRIAHYVEAANRACALSIAPRGRS